MRKVMVLAVVGMQLAACNQAPFVEEHDTKSGEFRGLRIGMNMEQAFSTARSLGAKLIAPIPCDNFRVNQGNQRDLPALDSLEGIRITDSHGLFEDLYFRAGRVVRVESSPKTSPLLSVSNGDATSGLREKIISLLQTRQDLMVHAIVNHEDQDVVSLSETMPTTYLHDCWRFELTDVKPAGATFDLTFNRGSLTDILYRRARIRSE
jgi:hypothetical protein